MQYVHVYVNDGSQSYSVIVVGISTMYVYIHIVNGCIGHNYTWCKQLYNSVTQTHTHTHTHTHHIQSRSSSHLHLHCLVVSAGRLAKKDLFGLWYIHIHIHAPDLNQYTYTIHSPIDITCSVALEYYCDISFLPHCPSPLSPPHSCPPSLPPSLPPSPLCFSPLFLPLTPCSLPFF